MTAPQAVVKRIVRRTWADYIIPSNGFTTVTTHKPNGWQCEIGKGHQWVMSETFPHEGSAQAHAVALANQKWPIPV